MDNVREETTTGLGIPMHDGSLSIVIFGAETAIVAAAIAGIAEAVSCHGQDPHMEAVKTQGPEYAAQAAQEEAPLARRASSRASEG